MKALLLSLLLLFPIVVFAEIEPQTVSDAVIEIAIREAAIPTVQMWGWTIILVFATIALVILVCIIAYQMHSKMPAIHVVVKGNGTRKREDVGVPSESSLLLVFVTTLLVGAVILCYKTLL